jgi:plasmid maintenance system antidote protein VapI/DNA-binding MarR family transcriptional regulator
MGDLAMNENQENVKFPLDFHFLLQREFMGRCRKNPRYSIRAFARALKINHSTLSKLIRGKRRITKSTLLQLGPHLGLSAKEIEHFVSRLNSEEVAAMNYHQLSLDLYQIIADWYHYAIFELITLKDFQPNHRWIAKKLQITPTEVTSAVDRLTRVGLIEIKNHRKWIQKTPLITTVGNEFTAAAFRELQRGILKKAILALEEIPFEFRDQSSMTMAVNSSMLPEAKKKIKNFRRNLCKFLQKNKERDAVYQLGISLYPLTVLTDEKKTSRL